MNHLTLLFDLLLALTLVMLAGAILVTSDLFKAVVLFITLGLLMAVAWVRLDAVDLALAEAAIGAGLTGALFLNALASMGSKSEYATVGQRPIWMALGILVGSLIGLLAFIAIRTPTEQTPVAKLAYAELPRSEVGNPVTAVLLNFRSYDTLLEVGVLLLALVGVQSLAARTTSRNHPIQPGPVLLTLVRILIPHIVLVAAYLLWIGTKEPGGAFQAGAMLSAAGVLLVVGGVISPSVLSGWSAQIAASVGLLVFLALAVGVMLTGGRFLEYPTGWAGLLILIIESILTLCIAIMLAAMFVGCGEGRIDYEEGS
jgi:multisubunit Na+/H+ antiporter MnhB subunit